MSGISTAEVKRFPRYRQRRLYAIVDGYFLVKQSQGVDAAREYLLRSTPIQLRTAVVNLIKERNAK